MIFRAWKNPLMSNMFSNAVVENLYMGLVLFFANLLGKIVWRLEQKEEIKFCGKCEICN